MRKIVFQFSWVLLCAPALLAAQTAVAGDTHAAVIDMLHPGDAVRVRVWREPELSGEFSVDERGNVILPRLGTRNVTGIPSDTLKNRLVSDYAAYFKTPPEISFLRRVSVLGAVSKPGLYMADPTMSISALLALAGGPSGSGQTDRVKIKRSADGTTSMVTLNKPGPAPPLYSGDEIIVPQRSWLARNLPLTLTLIGTTLSIISFIGR